MRLITWELALGHLKRSVALVSPPSLEEIDLRGKIDQAEALVLSYVNQRVRDGDLWGATVNSWDTAGTPPVPPPAEVQAAVLTQLLELYRFRGDDLPGEEPARDVGATLHPRAAGYLYRLRDPALA